MRLSLHLSFTSSCLIPNTPLKILFSSTPYTLSLALRLSMTQILAVGKIIILFAVILMHNFWDQE
jgi:hypothetical protein